MYVCGPQESKSSYQSWPQAPLTAEPLAPQQLFSSFVNHTLKIDSILYSQSFSLETLAVVMVDTKNQPWGRTMN